MALDLGIGAIVDSVLNFPVDFHHDCYSGERSMKIDQKTLGNIAHILKKLDEFADLSDLQFRGAIESANGVRFVIEYNYTDNTHEIVAVE